MTVKAICVMLLYNYLPENAFYKIGSEDKRVIRAYLLLQLYKNFVFVVLNRTYLSSAVKLVFCGDDF